MELDRDHYYAVYDKFDAIAFINHFDFNDKLNNRPKIKTVEEYPIYFRLCTNSNDITMSRKESTYRNMGLHRFDITFESVRRIDDEMLIPKEYSRQIVNENINKLNEGNEMIELLKRYKEKQIAKLKEDYNDKRNAILQYDPDFTTLSRLATERCEYSEHVKEYVRVDIDSYRSNMESVNKDLNRLEFEVEDDIIKLDEKIKDIEAVLELATTFEQKRDILVSYGVLNCNGTLVD